MNCEIHLHDQRAEPASRKALLIFFVTGNPGLIEYYRTFLTHVYGILSKASIDSRDAGLADFDLHVNGRNLAGYGISSSYINFDENAALKRRLPLGLKDQIEYVEDSLEDTVRKIKAQRLLDKVHVKAEPNDGGKIPRDESKFPSRPVKVVLAGHSLGTYINLELLRRYKERTRLRQSRPANHTGRNHTTPPGAQDDPISEETKRRLMMQEDNGDDFELIGVTNICPTVTDLADSPSGRAVTAYGGYVLHPSFAKVLGSFVQLATVYCPFSVLRRLVKFVTGMPLGAASITAEFLRSPMGVTQSLHLARDELLEITVDKWDHEVWGAPASNSTASAQGTTDDQAYVPLYFLFAQSDHWIADHTRATLIASHAHDPNADGIGDISRGREKAYMEIDNQIGMGHAFCLNHSIPVAEKIAEYVLDVVSRCQS